MSRTFKDRPYALIEDEARSRGFSHTYDCGRFHWEYVEVAKYAYSRKRNPHIPARRWRIGGGLRTIGIRITGIKPESVTH